jgi:hypothetical protein
VAPGQRGNGIGSILFDTAVEESAQQGFTNFNALLENERTAKCFQRFDTSDLVISEVGENWILVPTELTIDDAIKYLATWRQIIPSKHKSSRIITPTTLHVSANIQ